MKRILMILLCILLCTMFTGCGKNVDKMTDQEFYEYLVSMDEETREEKILKMTDEQQYRAFLVLTLVEMENASIEDDFKNEIYLPIYEDVLNTEETTNNIIKNSRLKYVSD